MHHKEKCLESIHIHTGESLKRDLQDLAMHQDRTVGELIRTVLEQHVYGAKQRMLPSNAADQAH